jgi:hypothetical protein
MVFRVLVLRATAEKGAFMVGYVMFGLASAIAVPALGYWAYLRWLDRPSRR